MLSCSFATIERSKLTGSGDYIAPLCWPVHVVYRGKFGSSKMGIDEVILRHDPSASRYWPARSPVRLCSRFDGRVKGQACQARPQHLLITRRICVFQSSSVEQSALLLVTTSLMCGSCLISAGYSYRGPFFGRLKLVEETQPCCSRFATHHARLTRSPATAMDEYEQQVVDSRGFWRVEGAVQAGA